MEGKCGAEGVFAVASDREDIASGSDCKCEGATGAGYTWSALEGWKIGDAGRSLRLSISMVDRGPDSWSPVPARQADEALRWVCWVPCRQWHDPIFAVHLWQLWTRSLKKWLCWHSEHDRR